MDVLFTIQGTDRPPDARFKFSRKLVIPVGGGVFVSLLLHFDDYMLAVPGHELTQIEAGDEEDELWTGDLHIEISMKFFDAVGTDRWELGVRVRTRFRPDRTVWQTTKSSLWLIFDDGSEIELPVYDAE